MRTAFRAIAPEHPCAYLPTQLARLEYEHVVELSPEEYMGRMLQGWRRFGHDLFRPRCRLCAACQPLRIDVARFRPDRSQRRAGRANAGSTRIEVAPPTVTRAHLDLFARYHAHQARAKHWPSRDDEGPASYRATFVDNPLPTQEWRYWRDDELVGVGYVDDLPGGLSAIYFYYDPDDRDLSLGTWNVLSLIAHAAQRGLPHVYLGYYVAGCPSMAYKARFAPNQILGEDGRWRDFRGG
ncbi:MAG TPA: arginyltransferase [Isosphaeraceae bacterium]|jgi:arginine-tRNA-protein transferase